MPVLPGPSPALTRQRMRLVIIAPASLPVPAGLDEVIALDPAAINATALARAAPDLVILPLILRDHDAITLLTALEASGYRGAALVLAPALPNPTAIAAELVQAAPRVTVRLVSGNDPVSLAAYRAERSSRDRDRSETASSAAARP